MALKSLAGAFGFHTEQYNSISQLITAFNRANEVFLKYLTPDQEKKHPTLANFLDDRQKSWVIKSFFTSIFTAQANLTPEGRTTVQRLFANLATSLGDFTSSKLEEKKAVSTEDFTELLHASIKLTTTGAETNLFNILTMPDACYVWGDGKVNLVIANPVIVKPYAEIMPFLMQIIGYIGGAVKLPEDVPPYIQESLRLINQNIADDSLRVQLKHIYDFNQICKVFSLLFINLQRTLLAGAQFLSALAKTVQDIPVASPLAQSEPGNSTQDLRENAQKAYENLVKSLTKVKIEAASLQSATNPEVRLLDVEHSEATRSKTRIDLLAKKLRLLFPTSPDEFLGFAEIIRSLKGLLINIERNNYKKSLSDDVEETAHICDAIFKILTLLAPNIPAVAEPAVAVPPGEVPQFTAPSEPAHLSSTEGLADSSPTTLDNSPNTAAAVDELAATVAAEAEDPRIKAALSALTSSTGELANSLTQENTTLGDSLPLGASAGNFIEKPEEKMPDIVLPGTATLGVSNAELPAALRFGNGLSMSTSSDETSEPGSVDSGSTSAFSDCKSVRVPYAGKPQGGTTFSIWQAQPGSQKNRQDGETQQPAPASEELRLEETSPKIKHN